MSTFVLVHGACRDGSAWGRVRALINERDEQVTTAGPAEIGRAHV